MRKIIKVTILIAMIASLQSCWFYSFTGASIGADVKTIQIDYFPNNAPLVEPSLSREFTTRLQDMFLRQTNLSLVKTGGDLQLEGEITGYRIEPTSATANQTAAQNRLTITVKVRFYNNKNEEDNYEKTFSHFYDYGGSEQLIGGQLESAFDEILTKINEDIFNASVAKW
ncbi:MAG: LptE family protein [Flavobacteriaceae bacterium]|nr:LptE family protein [Flavobacteriaceae bacterium]